MMSSGILNAYVHAPVTEKVWTVLDHELDSDANKTVVKVVALCGLKSAGAAFKSQFVSCMESLRYLTC